MKFTNQEYLLQKEELINNCEACHDSHDDGILLYL